MEEKHADVKGGVGYETGDVQGKKIKAQSNHTASPAVEKNLGTQKHAQTY